MHKALKEQRQSYVRLADILLELGMIDPATLDKAIIQYRDHGRLALRDFLVQNHYLTPDQLHQALTVQQGRFRRLGEVLVDMKLLTKPQLQEILRTKDSPA